MELVGVAVFFERPFRIVALGFSFSFFLQLVLVSYCCNWCTVAWCLAGLVQSTLVRFSSFDRLSYLSSGGKLSSEYFR